MSNPQHRIAELEAQARRTEQFLAILGHELRNPLGAMQAAVDVIVRSGEAAAAAPRAVAVLERQIRHLSRLADDLLDMSRASLGKLSLELQLVDLAEVVRRSEQALAAEVRAANHGLELDLPVEAVAVAGDPMRLEQVVTNLLMNAIKYTPRGGHLRVEVRRAGGDAVELEVSDDGIGMPADSLARVFELFAQAEEGADRSRGGLGIGLALVRRLVELHGGQVSAASPGAGAGSCFTVRLPAAPSR